MPVGEVAGGKYGIDVDAHGVFGAPGVAAGERVGHGNAAAPRMFVDDAVTPRQAFDGESEAADASLNS